MRVLFTRGDLKVLFKLPYYVAYIYTVKTLILKLVKLYSLMAGEGAEVYSTRCMKSLNIAFREWLST